MRKLLLTTTTALVLILAAESASAQLYQGNGMGNDGGGANNNPANIFSTNSGEVRRGARPFDSMSQRRRNALINNSHMLDSWSRDYYSLTGGDRNSSTLSTQEKTTFSGPHARDGHNQAANVAARNRGVPE